MLNKNCPCNTTVNQEELMHTINQSSFAVYDMLLYLDTHPDDREVIKCFEEQLHIRKKALKEHAEYFGPLNIDFMDDEQDTWLWMKQPWPWECKKKGRC